MTPRSGLRGSSQGSSVATTLSSILGEGRTRERPGSDLERKTRIVGEDDVLRADLGEASDDFFAGALEDAGHAAAGLVAAGVALAEARGERFVDDDGDGVAGEGVLRVAGADLNGVGAGSVGICVFGERGDDEGGAAGAELDAAGEFVIRRFGGGRRA